MERETSVGFRTPPRALNGEGAFRKVGFELEFAGLTPDQAAGTVVSLFGGEWRRENAFSGKVRETPYGDFSVELDSSLLKEKRYEDYLRRVGLDVRTLDLAQEIEESVASLAATVVPCEIGLPPLPLTELTAADRLREGLRLAGAQGTKSSIFYAFGLHINPEVPDRSASTYLAVLRAFLLLYDWLLDALSVDFTRRLVPFIRDFPDVYRRRVVDPAYAPDLDGLVDDYLRYNPTRNRPLDMLPLFCLTHEGIVCAALESGEPIKPRPAFHYRLPNCLVDDERWTVAEEWNNWVVVETLAESPVEMEALAREFLKTGSGSAWAERTRERLGLEA